MRGARVSHRVLMYDEFHTHGRAAVTRRARAKVFVTFAPAQGKK